MRWPVVVAILSAMSVGLDGKESEVLAQAASAPRPEATPADTSGWTALGGQGMMQFVLVAKAREADTVVYQRAIRALCKAGKHCYLLFWSDRREVPQRLPMTDRQASTQVASYTKNPKTGFEEMLWNCRIKNDPRSCFR